MRRSGVGVIVMRDGMLLLGRRCGARGFGHYAVPGGAQDPGESHEQTAVRELAEETGLAGRDPIVLGSFAETVDGELWQTTFVIVQADGEPQRLEPSKSAGWQFYPLGRLPGPLFAALPQLLASGALSPFAA